MPTVNDVLVALQPWLQRQRRLGWAPLVEDRDGQPTASKFSGTPWLAAGEDWPQCPNCHKPRQLLLQLDLAALPAELRGAFGAGLLQVFYCTTTDPSCEVALEGWEPSSRCHLVRVVQPSGAPAAPSSRPTSSFPARTIAGWRSFPDLPHPPEHEVLGLQYRYDFQARTVRVVCPELGVDLAGVPFDAGVEEAVGTAAPGDKLAGWPCWVQGVEYPRCPRCSATMRLVFQIDSEDHLSFMFGDAGCAHVTQCPTHLDVVALAWACG